LSVIHRITKSISRKYTYMTHTTMYIPKIKQPAEPAKPAIVAIAVAVVRCSGGNHSAEIVGPAVNTTGPAEPIMNCDTCANLHSKTRHFNVYFGRLKKTTG